MVDIDNILELRSEDSSGCRVEFRVAINKIHRFFS